MAESILFRSAGRILERLSSLAYEEIRPAWGLESEVKRLTSSLSCIKAVISDAEVKQIKSSQIKNWLEQLELVLNDAKDVLDEFNYQVLHEKIVSARRGGQVLSVFSVPIDRLKIGRKIKDIRKRIDEIADDKVRFNLAELCYNGPIQLLEREMTYSQGSDYKIIGRHDDREAVVKFLTDGSLAHVKKVTVIPIVGIGGVGKTALAQTVFNDRRVANHFELKLWVCLGDMKEFNVTRVMKNIVKSMTGKKCAGTSVEYLLQVIQENVQNKRCLFVFDDLWEANHDDWVSFEGLFDRCVEGSKVVVTTRDSSVASCVGTVAAHNLEGLPHMDCVSLFKKMAFASAAAVDEDLMKIGDEIVKKCKGVPLAVIALGGQLFSKPEEEWLLVRDSSVLQIKGPGNPVLPILKFSYDSLLSDLKQCFVSCSSFPEDYRFSGKHLIQFWMAHGLLEVPKEKLVGKKISAPSLEDVGQEYIEKLLSIGFFQDYKDFGDLASFKMHDLVRDLACSIGGEEFAVIDDKDKNIGKNVRHAWFEVQTFSADLNNGGIQSVLVPDYDFGATISFVEACIKFKHLKFLGLADSMFEELPKSIGTLIHLRSLNLTNCRRLKRLRSSVCKLHFLETLLLRGCVELEELPKNFGELLNLITLEITTKQKQLTKEKGIGCLTSLHNLLFDECPNLEILLEGTQIAHLKSLRTLKVFNCASLISLVQMSSTDTENCLPDLKVLFISKCDNLNLNCLEYQQQRDDSAPLLQCLQLPRLKLLAFELLTQLEDTWPQWIQGSASTLRSLQILDCENLVALPEWLSNLTSLRTLKIHHCPRLKSLPQGMDRLRALKGLHITKSNKLSIAEIRGEDRAVIAHVPNSIPTELKSPSKHTKFLPKREILGHINWNDCSLAIEGSSYGPESCVQLEVNYGILEDSCSYFAKLLELLDNEHLLEEVMKNYYCNIEN